LIIRSALLKQRVFPAVRLLSREGERSAKSVGARPAGGEAFYRKP
jgi:hypothetical protein